MGHLNPKQFHSRIWGVVLVLALLLTFLCSNLYSIQYTNGPEYAAQAVARVAETEDVPASRGLILDRNGKVLVSNEISYQVTLDMSRMGKPEEAFTALAAALRYSPPRAELCCDLGQFFFHKGDYPTAAFWYETALSRPRPDQTGAFVSPDCYGYLPCIQLCVCYSHLGDQKRAETFNELAAACKPDSSAVLHNRAIFQSLSESLPR